MRILLIEDDHLIGDGLSVGLHKLGFAIDWFSDGLTGSHALDQASYDAVLLDLGLPAKSGLAVLEEWRGRGHQEPVLILTAQGDVDQKVAGLNAGADDYVVKPFALAEIAARLNALIRRRHGKVEQTITQGSLSFSQVSRQVTLGNQPVSLSPKEIMLLELFLLNPTQVFSKSMIEEKLYAWGEELQSNAVEVHIHHLRRKLGTSFIKTVHKIGYRLGKQDE